MSDETTLKLIEEVTKRKKEISDAERPNWKTNCSFQMGDQHVNLHVAGKGVLIEVLSFLIGKMEHHCKAVALLDISVDFMWGGFKFDDWLDDIRTRMNKVTLADKKKKLEKLESRLEGIVSPELRRKLELESIERELNDN